MTHLYSTKKYEILERSLNTRLFNPRDYGFNTYSKATCCWKGYVCDFKLEQNHLLIDSLSINSNAALKLNNVEPSIIKKLSKKINPKIFYLMQYSLIMRMIRYLIMSIKT